MAAWFRKPDIVTTLQEQGGGVVSSARRTVLRSVEHAESLLQLFRLELREYGARQARRLVAIVAGVGLLLVAYLLLCAALCVLLSMWTGLLAAVCIVFLLNALLGVTALLYGLRTPAGPVAPATTNELKTDLQCLKILIGENKKS